MINSQQQQQQLLLQQQRPTKIFKQSNVDGITVESLEYGRFW